MRKLISIFLVLSFMFFNTARATVHVIDTYNNYFTPDSLTVLVGDTIQWNWIEGLHTTSSNGIPDTAAPWNVVLDSTHTQFQYVVLVPGVFNYISVPDAPGMNGMFEALSTSGIDENSFAPHLLLMGNLVDNELTVQFSLPAGIRVEFSLIDLKGNQTVLSNNYFSAGMHTHTFMMNDNPQPGIHLFCLKAGNLIETKKVLITM